jgi:MFS family permease
MRSPSRLRQLAPLVVLLLAQFALRTHHITAVDPYIDEGYHVARAAVVWDFDTHPGRFSAGKLLLYFWLGLFESDVPASLTTARLSIALFSLLNGALITLFGRLLSSHRTGLLALALYAILPFAAFYDRLALADPFAAVFAGLVVWRSMVFARHPSQRQGALLGALLALALMAKLTLALMVLFPLAAALLLHSWHGSTWRSQAATWSRAYVPPLAAAAIVGLLMWLPLLIPAYAARHSDAPFRLLDAHNIRADESASAVEPVRFTTGRYLWEVLPLIDDFTTAGLLILVVAAFAFWLGAAPFDPARFRRGLLVALWLLLIVGPPLALATFLTTRYFVPAAAPATLALAHLITSLWGRSLARRLAAGVVIAGVAAWAITFAAPFLRTMTVDPARLNLTGGNWIEFLSGYISGDETTRAAARALNALEPAEHIYATDRICHLMAFYAEPRLTCLAGNTGAQSDMARRFEAELDACGFAHVVLRGYPPAIRNIPGTSWEPLDTFESPIIDRPVTIWRVTWVDRCPG